MKKRDESGFALMEIIVVLAILGILATIAVPTFLTWRPNLLLKRTARDLYSNIQKTKLEAVKRNVCTGMQFTTADFPAKGGSYTVFVDDDVAGGNACNGTLDSPAETALYTIEVDRGVSLTKATNMGGASAICFTPLSVICGSQHGNVQVRNDRSRWYKTTISASGGVRLEMSNDGVHWSL